MITLQSLWIEFVNYGYQVRITGKKGDQAWSKVKKPLSEIDLKFSLWNEKCKTYFRIMKNDLKLFGDTIITQDKKEINDHQDHQIWESHHFMLQHGRIVANNDPSLLRFLQIAYNCGQLKAIREKDQSMYSLEQLKFYDDPENGMTQINSYIPVEDQSKFEDVINEVKNKEKILFVLQELKSLSE